MAAKPKNKDTEGMSNAFEDIEEAHRRFLGGDGGDGGVGGVLEPLPAYPDLCTQPPVHPAVPTVATSDIWGSAEVVVSSQDA